MRKSTTIASEIHLNNGDSVTYDVHVSDGVVVGASVIPPKRIERPILFSTPMIQAILENRKSQTRRFLKPQPNNNEYCEITKGYFVPIEKMWKYCPYGQIGDKLWVRETFAIHPRFKTILYRADGEEYPDAPNYGIWKPTWTPSIFLPRKYSRITLEITEIRVQRLQSITPSDCLAEGIDLPIPKGCEIPDPPKEYKKWNKERRDEWINSQARATYFSRCFDIDNHLKAYKELWNKINEKRGYGWAKNPWVWVISFKKITP